MWKQNCQEKITELRRYETGYPKLFISSQSETLLPTLEACMVLVIVGSELRHLLVQLRLLFFQTVVVDNVVQHELVHISALSLRKAWLGNHESVEL